MSEKSKNRISLKGATWDSMFLTFSKVLTMLFGIILTKIMSTGLTLTEYGAYSQVNLVTSLGASVILLGLVDAVNLFFNKKDGSDDEEHRIVIVNTVFFLECTIGLVLAVLIILGRTLIGDYFSNEAIEGILIVASVIPLSGNIIFFYQMLYVSVGKAKLMAFYNLALMIFKIISAYTAVYIIGNIFWIYVVIVVLDLIQIGVFKVTLAKEGVRINIFKIDTKYIGRIFAYSLPMGVYAITSALTRDIDKLLIGRMDGTEAMAIYANCSKQLPIDFLVMSFATVLMPYIVRFVTEGNKAEITRLFAAYMRVGYYSVWILSATLLIAPGTVISLLYDDKFLTGLPIFVLYIFDSMTRFASVHLILTAAGKTKTIMLYSFISLVMNTVLNVLFYYWWGVIGPAIATLVVAVIYTCLIIGKTMNVIHCKIHEVFSLKDIMIALISLVLLIAVCKLLFNGLCRAGIHQYIAMIISMAVLGCSSLAIHFKRIKEMLGEINSFKIE